MHVWSDQHFIRRILFALDLAASAVGYGLALLVRFTMRGMRWKVGAYSTFLVLTLLISISLNLYRRVRHRRYSLTEMDPVEMVSGLVRDRAVQYIILVLLLYAVRTIDEISRLVIVLAFAFDLILSTLSREILRSWMLRAKSATPAGEHYVIVTTRDKETAARRRLTEWMPENTDITGIVFVDAGDEDPGIERTGTPRFAAEDSEGDAFRRNPEGDCPKTLTPGRKSIIDGAKHNITLRTEVLHELSASLEEGRATAPNPSSVPCPIPDALRHVASAEHTHVFLYLDETHQQEIAQISSFCRAQDIPLHVFTFLRGQELPASMVSKGSGYAVIDQMPLRKEGHVFGVRFAPTDVESAVFHVLEKVRDDRSAMTGTAAPDNNEMAALQEGSTRSESEIAADSPEGNRGTVGPADGAQTPYTGGKGKCGTAGSLSGEYICFSNVHTTVMAHDDPSYREVLNGSALTFADGRPIAQRLRGEGFPGSVRVAGPDFMDAMFRATMDGKAGHYFYGSTQETIERLGEELPKRYPGIRIVGIVSPPFRPETPEEDAASVAAINASGADFVWIGLGAPKQERWMAAHRGRVDGVMLGVGAGFDFYAGTVKRAPSWVQKIGLEWFYRLLQDPKRLANRYVVTNIQYMWYSLRERMG